MRRQGPRSVAHALDAVTARMAPATPLAEVQRAWPAAAGAFADQARPVAERGGVVTVACASAVWAQELDLLAPRVVAALNAHLGADVVSGLRVLVRS